MSAPSRVNNIQPVYNLPDVTNLPPVPRATTDAVASTVGTTSIRSIEERRNSNPSDPSTIGRISAFRKLKPHELNNK